MSSLKRLIGVATIAALGCGNSDDGAFASSESAATAGNGLTPNGLTPNGLTPNGLTPNGLTPNGLTPNGLTPNGMTPNGMTPNGMTPNGMTPNGMTPNGMTPNGMTPNGMTPNGMTPNGMTPNGMTPNGMTPNGMTPNGMTPNGLTPNGMASIPLTAESLLSYPAMAAALSDPVGLTFLHYVVSCAMKRDDVFEIEVGGEIYEFSGDLGLAPEWAQKGGRCGQSCQQWVSACLLARVNAAGVSQEISARGAHRGLALEAGEAEAYPVVEGAYAANLFVAPQARYGCTAGDMSRICGASLDGCPFRAVGRCEDICRKRGKDGSFRDCGGEGKGEVKEVVTVFLAK